ncbi:glycerophosphodiester phosphodiesterase family protein [Gluconobacter wancherniae]|uniref:glycerophosphodiester phosphodiesterase n=1 Tax=Gluconobacter wancherniae NBRC 103581 TaxID=656744 RepID=A0A511AWJ8_9PROT|nr:glycerophosphodiester phosphodiesterase family protein [Gluconobacter wancherniae]MBF0852767.1 glycerophosphodiester phosphodiesterase [Gluconobacter wancherniae]MBS1061889.1 glycerophosphodiester phosphodiesterase [Gluconobacter wancherniae]GBD56519.1 glycerophosphoryl diester phosphodiesterase [Gluconobacter wancherniae NBRC 103581]GBR64028.1 glycerophosphoryl diester phosphodiesterase [Gluconobacter wancherniae NBRC 103581]GEK92579.1 glycerophosphoryl diester phosphodiesterase [Gluconoba
MLSRRKTLGLLSLALPALHLRAKAAPSLAPKALVFAHRGASALRPEHTLASYARAMADGADFIEPDLVMTKDGVLVVRHESNIAGTTDVADHPEFASRRRTQMIDGREDTGWFTTDFTLAELKTLRARERLSTIRVHNTRYDDHFTIPTFEEVIEIVAAEAAACGKTFGLVPELKHSTHFHALGHDPEATFLKIIASHEYTRQAPLEVQSFETGNLGRIRKQILDINPQARLMLLMGERNQIPPDLLAAGKKTTFGDLMTRDGLTEIRRYADVIGPSNTDLIPRDAKGAWLEPSTLVSDAHKAGLLVHSYTARPENCFLPAQLRNDAGPTARNPAGMIAEIRRYLDLGLDGFFTDDPALGRKAVDSLD